MNIEKAIKILHQHNLWRRGAEIEPLRPSVIGEAIDLIVHHYTMQKIDETANAPNNPWRNIRDKEKWLAQVRGYQDDDDCIILGQEDSDYFTSVPVTSCCHIGPITNEKYCPECGAKIQVK